MCDAIYIHTDPRLAVHNLGKCLKIVLLYVILKNNPLKIQRIIAQNIQEYEKSIIYMHQAVRYKSL